MSFEPGEPPVLFVDVDARGDGNVARVQFYCDAESLALADSLFGAGSAGSRFIKHAIRVEAWRRLARIVHESFSDEPYVDPDAVPVYFLDRKSC